jgi:glycosyltransferase involved in cell wall biosynthesis
VLEGTLRPLEISGSDHWVLVAGSFHRHGGMDRANTHLALYLAARGAQVQIVAHEVSSELRNRPGVTVHLAPYPARSFFLGEWPLSWLATRVAARTLRQHPKARVLVNGSNCAWPDLNWVHSVHHAWPCYDNSAPLWFRLKNRLVKRRAEGREAVALRRAGLVIANSERTKRDLIDRIGVDEQRVRTVYLAADPEMNLASPEERASARAWLGQSPNRPLVAFVGSLGYDNNKGFDILWASWRHLCAQPDWNADLVVAGGGRALSWWQREVARHGLGARVRFLGFSQRIADLLAASDLLVSPVRYEAYGMNVREAISRGVPALVSSSAGVSEHYPRWLRPMLLPDPEDIRDLAQRLIEWNADIPGWRDRFLPLGDSLRAYTWSDMAYRIVNLAKSIPPAQPRGI